MSCAFARIFDDMSNRGVEVIILADFVEPMKGPIQRFLERNPHLGIFASVAGFTTMLLSLVKVLSVLLGFGGAVFGFIAGYYTMRSAHRKWTKQKTEDALKRSGETTTV